MTPISAAEQPINVSLKCQYGSCPGKDDSD
jgi:hypothetical protein